jgi:chromosomal replication initiator protein
MNAIWQNIKTQLQSELPKNTFSLWVHPITYLEKKDQTVILNCPNKFSRNWVMENYFDRIQDKLCQAGAAKVELVFRATAPKAPPEAPFIAPAPKQMRFPSISGNGGGAHLRKDFTFDRFVVGKCNEFAYSASKALAHGGCLDYHCLLMLANTGLGKSHLSHAIGHSILKRKPTTRVHYMTAEAFTNEMISSLKHNRIEAFKDKYRRCCDVLLLEEIHFLSGKQKTQSELGYTLDCLANGNKSIICTSALAPKDVPRMSGELTSRLTAGLVTTIGGPDFDTRVRIVTKKAAEHNLSLSDEIIEFLASRLRGDVRQMESALKSLRARAELLKAKVDLELAKEVVKCLVSGERSVSVGEIGQLVCQYYKVEPGLMQSASRKKVHARPRNIYVYLCRRHTDETIQEIAKTIHRSHSAVVYASELVEHKMKRDEKLRHQVEFLSQKLENMKT